MERNRSQGGGGEQDQPMLVVLPESLAVSHLRQCERHLKTILEDRIGFLYAAEASHLALHTMLVAARYPDIGLGIMRFEGKETYPGGPKEGGEIKSFRALFQDIRINNDDRQAIMLLTDIRDKFQHPIPGPMGYIVRDLISGIAAAIRVTIGLWGLPCFAANSDGPARHEALAASQAILVHCSTVTSPLPS